MRPSGVMVSGMIAGNGRQLTPERRERTNNMVEPDFSSNGCRFVLSERRFAQNWFLRVAVSIFPISTADFVEKTPRGEFLDPRTVIAQF